MVRNKGAPAARQGSYVTLSQWTVKNLFVTPDQAFCREMDVKERLVFPCGCRRVTGVPECA